MHGSDETIVPPVDSETRRKRELALDLVEEAEHLALQQEFGKKIDASMIGNCLRQAREADPECPGVLAHSGELAARAGNAEEGEKLIERAIEVAEERLGGDEKERYGWWGEEATRPYMRAKQALATFYWNRENYSEAARIFQDLLERNPFDNQGARYVIGPLHLLNDDIESALDSFKSYAAEYPDDMGDPHHYFSWGLALFLNSDFGESVQVFWRALASNVYLAPLLLNRKPPPRVHWTSNLEEPEYAGEYVEVYGRLWTRTREPAGFLQTICDHPLSEERLEKQLALGRALESEPVGTERNKLVKELSGLEYSKPPRQVFEALGIQPPKTSPFDQPKTRPAREKEPQPRREEPPKPPFTEALKAGVAQQMILEALGAPLGNPSTKINRAINRFTYDDLNEAQRAADMASKAWNELMKGELKKQTVKSGPKVGRNDPCPCGSGRKYKKCCLGSQAP